MAGALATLARPLAAQQAAPRERSRSLLGGSLLVLGTSGFNAPMIALRTTKLHGDLVAPDFTAGLYLHNGAELADFDLGLGRAIGVRETGVVTVSVGPALLVAITGGGRGAVVGVQGRIAVVLPFDVNLGVRLEAGGSLYQTGQYTTRLWMVGFGLTTLGALHADLRR